jgi:hypothetical protein
MAVINWQEIMGGYQQQKKRYSGANVKFFNAYNENKEKSQAAGRAIFDEIPSISIQWPGGDETVRRIEPQDIAEYPEMYAAFQSGNTPVDSGTPLSEWPPMNGSAMRELQYLGFKTVEQLAATSDEVKRKLGPLSKFVKLAEDWIGAANSDQFQVTKLKNQLEREQSRVARLEDQVELLLQRIEGNEGIDLRPKRKEIVEELDDEPQMIADVITTADNLAARKRGRPKKI